MVQSINNSDLTLNLLRSSQQSQQTALERLSSGSRINSAIDDAAGLLIANQFSSQSRGLEQAARNASDGISFSQIASGALETVNNDLQRIRELSLQASNGLLDDNARNAIQAEVSQLQDNIQDTLERTRFNDTEIFTTDANINFQVGENEGDTIQLALQDVTSDFSDILNADVSTAAGATQALGAVDDAVQVVSDLQVNFGANENRLQSTINNNFNAIENAEAARSRIQDADFARTVSDLVKANIQQQSGIAVQSQANASAEQVLRLLS